MAQHNTAVDEASLRQLLQQVQAGEVAPDDAVAALRRLPWVDLGFARVDHHRHIRQGFPEVIYGAGKTPNQVASIAERIVSAGHSLLVTRTDPVAYEAVREKLPEAEFHELARAITLRVGEIPRGRGTIAIAAAGTADLPVAEEAAVAAEIMTERIPGRMRSASSCTGIKACRAYTACTGTWKFGIERTRRCRSKKNTMR